MSGKKNDKTKDVGSKEPVESLSTEIQKFIDHNSSEAQENLNWLQTYMHPYFFAAFRDEAEAVYFLVTNLSSLSNNKQLVLADRENTLIVGKKNQRGSVCETIEALKGKDISYTYITNSYATIPNLSRELEIQRFEFGQKSDKEIAASEKHNIAAYIKEPILDNLKKQYPSFNFDKFEDLLSTFWSNNDRYVKVSSPRRVARLMWLYQQTASHDGVYFGLEKAGTMGDKNETRILFGVANPPQKEFLFQLMKIFNRLNLGVHRCACLSVSNGTHPYFLGAFCVTTEDGSRIEKGSELYSNLKMELFHTQILGSSSTSYEKLFMPGIMNGAESSLVDAFIGFCHTNLGHNNPDVFGLEGMMRAFHTHIDASMQLIDLFKLRFDPAIEDRETKYQAALEKTIKMIENHSTGRRHIDDHRRTIFKCCLSFIQHTLKTNFFVLEKQALAFRLDPAYLTDLGENTTADLPPDRPFRVTYFHGQLGLGFHIGFSDIARGGWRTLITKGRDDYVTNANTIFKENYVLAHTQHFKNKDIYEGGSKMVAILNAGRETDPEKIKHLLYKHQYGFINAFMDIYLTENGSPKNPLVVDYYHEDEPIELGPDENMHDIMIETIANQAKKRGYMLGTGIMSSKKVGINHKEYGVTSTGVVKFADVALEQLGINMREDTFSVKLTGGPNGDVAGNAMLQLLDQCPNVKINMILDGTGAFYDPSGANHEELRRILLKKDLDAYNPKVFHPGAFILYRSRSKMDGMRQLFQKISRTRTGLEENWVSTDEFYREFDNMIFTVASDLFIPAGGRPETIDINNYHKLFNVDGTPLNRAIVEGANSFITPPARVELQKRGIMVIRDASANKCGVISSSYEIIANLLLSEDEFLAHKEEYVGNVVSILKKRAEDEARLIFKRYDEADGELLYTEISDAISTEINGFYAKLFDYFRNNLEICDQPLYQKAIIAHLPEMLKNNKLFSDRITQLPDKYKAAILASEIASSMVYSGNLEANFMYMVEGHLSRLAG
jgi:glutamate dehydrogenase